MGATDLPETPLENYRAVFDFNLFNGYELSRLVLPHMQEQGWGRIINIASIYGREHGGNIAYMSAKAGVIAASKHAGLSLAGSGVTVNSIAPGSILHPGGSWERFQREQSKEVVDAFISTMPMGEIRVAGADRRHVRLPRLEPCRSHNRGMHPGRRRSEPLADLTFTPS